jgi:CMP/dCMP kinase
MRITISGMPGSGKSTVVRIIKERLNLKNYYGVGNFRRSEAEKRGLSLAEFNKIGEKEEFTDRETDEWQTKIGKTQDDFIMDGRLSFHFVPNSIKIFLDISPEEGARRIFEAKREKEKYESFEKSLEQWKERVKSDSKRYSKYYGINPYDLKHYDFVLNTTKLSIEEVVEKIIKFIEENYGKS